MSLAPSLRRISVIPGISPAGSIRGAAVRSGAGGEAACQPLSMSRSSLTSTDDGDVARRSSSAFASSAGVTDGGPVGAGGVPEGDAVPPPHPAAAAPTTTIAVAAPTNRTTHILTSARRRRFPRHHPGGVMTPGVRSRKMLVGHERASAQRADRKGRTMGVLQSNRVDESAETLPFPPTPSASIAGRTMQESVYRRREAPRRLPADAPNIVIVLVDDAGPALPSTFGGEVRTATLDRVWREGVGFNRFHTTAMCSPTRASLLTGRNHHRVGNGQIAELANDWDGYSGHIPKSSALVADVLRHYGYATGAWGKWHNTPAEETTAAGPFDNWPSEIGFEYFYGFLAGEASQYEPNLVRNTTSVLPPRTPDEGYHLSEDLADDAIAWLRAHKALEPDKPFFMYWASGCLHGPHHIMKEWADRYAGVFDDGWDAYRERAFAGAKEKGWIPSDAELTPRHPQMEAWDDIPEEQKPFQRRLMEVAAGYAEHVDVQVGRMLDELDSLGYGDDTLVFYIWGDNGSSGEGPSGTISELLAQTGIPTTVEMHIAALQQLGGLDVLGSPITDNQYHAGWAWAGSAPYQGMKLLASHLGGTRNPMAIRWPARIVRDPPPRSQSHHCNDEDPTI